MSCKVFSTVKRLYFERIEQQKQQNIKKEFEESNIKELVPLIEKNEPCSTSQEFEISYDINDYNNEIIMNDEETEREELNVSCDDKTMITEPNEVTMSGLTCDVISISSDEEYTIVNKKKKGKKPFIISPRLKGGYNQYEIGPKSINQGKHVYLVDYGMNDTTKEFYWFIEFCDDDLKSIKDCHLIEYEYNLIKLK